MNNEKAVMAKVQEINASTSKDRVEVRVRDLLDRMSLEEKIGQLNQVEASADNVLDLLGDDIRAGQVGSIINQVDRDTVLELQRIAREESRLGIPLLVGRDVIHGWRQLDLRPDDRCLPRSKMGADCRVFGRRPCFDQCAGRRHGARFPGRVA
jgi:hypothetical protein